MSSNNHPVEIPVATVVEDPIKRIQIPPNLRPGDSFIVTDYGVPFTVVVPEGVSGGSYINVVVPEEATVVGSEERRNGQVKIDKSMAGAALLGVVVGTLIAGPVVGLICAGGAAYATTQTNSEVGKQVRTVGRKTFNTLSDAKKWAEKKIRCVDR